MNNENIEQESVSTSLQRGDQQDVDNQEVVEEQQDPGSVDGNVQDQGESDGKEQKSDAEINFKRLREEAAKAKKERDEARNYALQLEYYARQQQLQQQQQQQKQPEPDPDDDYSDDDILEGRHLKREINRLKKEMESSRKRYEESAIEQKIVSKYPDFYEVVNKDTISALRQADPELAESLHYNPNMYSKAISTYKQIKNLGLVPEDHYKTERGIAQKNSRKPRPTSSISPQQGESPLSMAKEFSGKLTPELKKQLYADMIKKSRGG